MMSLLPYARSEGGLGKLFERRHPVLMVIWALSILVGVGWLMAGLEGMFAGLAVVVITGLFCVYCHRKIGGMTGDTLGAVCEIAEVVTAAALAAGAFVGLSR